MDFSKYENKMPYPVRQKNLDSEVRRNIDNQRMTEAERQQAYKDALAEQDRKWRERCDALADETARLHALFYSDCRAELGYDDILDEAGCGVIEDYADRKGHAGGFCDVYSCLFEMAEVARALDGHFKK